LEPISSKGASNQQALIIDKSEQGIDNEEFGNAKYFWDCESKSFGDDVDLYDDFGRTCALRDQSDVWLKHLNTNCLEG